MSVRFNSLSLLFLFVGGFLLGYWYHSLRFDSLWLNNSGTGWVYCSFSSCRVSTNTGTSISTHSSFSRLIDTRIENAYEVLEKNYYHFSEARVSDIQDGIIRGFVDSLNDKHSEFLTTEETKEFNTQLGWDLEWIGAVVDAYDNGVVIERVLDDSPAKEAGLTPWDVILSANGQLLRNMKTSEAVKFIRGPANSPVEIVYLKRWVGEENMITIIRRKVAIPSVRHEIFTGVTQTGNIGYIDLSLFWEKSSEEFEKALMSIQESNPRGLILDLRQNGWGFLDVAVDILSHFFPKDKALVMTKENDPRNNSTLFSHGSPVSLTVPVVVLIDWQSASASEIVAGAFQDYKRGIIVGKTSYGKGSVQQPFPLQDWSELKITVARWFTPYDRGIDGQGIAPDISVGLTFEDYEKWYDRQLEEAKKVLNTWIQNGSRDETIQTFSHSWTTLSETEE